MSDEQNDDEPIRVLVVDDNPEDVAIVRRMLAQYGRARFQIVSAASIPTLIRDAFRIATHEAVRDGNEIRIVTAQGSKAEEAEFIMLKDGGIHFEGNAAALRASRDPYLRSFLS